MGEGTGEEKIRGEDGDGKVRLGECQADLEGFEPLTSRMRKMTFAFSFGCDILGSQVGTCAFDNKHKKMQNVEGTAKCNECERYFCDGTMPRV